MRFFKDILLPLSTTNIAALFVILFIYGWTQYLWPLLVTNANSMNTIVIALRKMVSFADADTPWNLVMVTAMLAILPPVLVVVLMQRWFVQGPGGDGEVMATISLSDVRKIYAGDVEAINGVSHRHARRRIRRARRPVGLRQVHAAAHGRRAGERSPAARSPSAAGSSTIWNRAERDIAMVFQNYALYPHMTVCDNMAYGLKNREHAEGRDRRRGSTRPPSMLEIDALPRPQAAASCPAASASASPWAARWCASPRPSCSTSRCRTSTPSCGCRCGSRSSRLQRAARHHRALRHPRPDRGDDAGRPARS